MELRIRNLFPSYLSKCPLTTCSDDNPSSSSSSSSSPCPCVYPPPPPPVEPSQSHIKTYLIITFSIFAFFLLCCYVLYAKFICPRRTRTTTTTTSQPQTQEDHFFDEEQQHGPVVDHPIWYIRTIGLQQSIIGAITVCKYKKGEGLIEGTECSVCLSEFQEDENLRLLPKCNHAFHLPCIDTWLRSHTNCPMCRAPIVIDPTRVPSMDPNAFGSRNSFVEMENLENRVEDTQNSGTGNVSRRSEEQQGVEESENLRSVVTVQPRRSVSLDSSSANKIILALATVMSGESHGNNNSKRVDGHGNSASKDSCSSSSSSSRTRYLHSEPSSMKRSRSFNAKHLLSWYNSRSQRKPNAPLRSF